MIAEKNITIHQTSHITLTKVAQELSEYTEL